MPKSVRLTREELYELVWTTPMQKLALQFGLSDRGLAKACARLGIAVPGRGYWARHAIGTAPARPPLRPTRDGEVRELWLDAHDPDEQAAEAARRDARREPPPVEVRPTLGRAHPAVHALDRALRQSRRDPGGMLAVPGEHGAVVRVTVVCRDRALRCLDALARALEQRETRVECAPGRDGAACRFEASRDGESCRISLVEKLRRIDHRPTGKHSLFEPKYDYVPSGKFTMSIASRTWSVPSRKWSDGATLLEDRLGEVVVAVEDELQQLRRRRLEEAARRLAEVEESRRREEAERRAKYEALLVEDLRGMATRWSEARGVRAFLEAYEGAMKDRGADVGSWIGWARRWIERHDPLVDLDKVAKDVEPWSGDPGWFER